MQVKVEAQKKPAYEEYVFKRDLKDDSELPLKPSPQIVPKSGCPDRKSLITLGAQPRLCDGQQSFR